jgi:hypothetical protein
MRAPKTKSTGTSFYSGGILVYRGYDAAVASKKAEQASRETPAEKESIIDDNSPKKSSAETPHAAGPGETGSDVTDLILVVHGIGQGVRHVGISKQLQIYPAYLLAYSSV